MLVYVLTGLVVFLSLRNYENLGSETFPYMRNSLKKFYKYSAIFIVSLVFGLRAYSVGTDTKSYLNIFNWLGTDLIWDNFIYEKGFCVISVIINKIFGNFTAFLLIFGIILYWNIITSICEISESPSISMLCYFGLGSFAQSCNILRQYLALSFCLVALRYLLKNNSILRFILFVFVGFLFHKSSAVFLIILPFKYIRFNFYTVLAFIFISVVSIVFLPRLLRIVDSILNTTYYGYIRFKSNPFTFTNICVLCILFIALFLIIKLRKNVELHTEKIKEYDFFVNIFMLFLSIFTISLFSAELIDRIAIYFMPSIFFLVPIVLRSFKTYFSRFVVNVLFVTFLLLIFFLFVVRGSYEILPYTFVNFI